MNNLSFKNNKPKQINSFNEMANNYCFWEYSADALLKSASILRREREREIQAHKGLSGSYRCPPEYFTEEVEWMLKAFALECLLKGLLVKSGHKIAENGKLKVNRNHALKNLAINVMGENNIQSNLQEALRKLSAVAILGRYPTAVNNNDLLKFCDEENTLGYVDSSVSITADEKSLIDTFISELLRKLKEEIG